MFPYDFRESRAERRASLRGFETASGSGRGRPEINVRHGGVRKEHRQKSFPGSGERGKHQGLANTCTGRRWTRSGASKTRFSFRENLCNPCRSIKANARWIAAPRREHLRPMSPRGKVYVNRDPVGLESCKTGRARWTTRSRKFSRR